MTCVGPLSTFFTNVTPSSSGKPAGRPADPVSASPEHVIVPRPDSASFSASLLLSLPQPLTATTVAPATIIAISRGIALLVSACGGDVYRRASSARRRCAGGKQLVPGRELHARAPERLAGGALGRV